MLSIALMCVMGTVQAVHSHADESATSHHTCTICATAHAGISTAAVVAVPIFATAALAISVSQASTIFRPASTQFIRPPPPAL